MNAGPDNSDSGRTRCRAAFATIVGSALPFLAAYIPWIAGRHESPEWIGAFHVGLGQLLLWMLIVLALVDYQLRANGEGWRDLGLSLKWWTIPAGFVTALAWGALWIGCAFVVTRLVEIDGTEETTARVLASLAKAPAGIGIAYMVVAACYEELVWRAFLISRLQQFGSHWCVAVALSAAIQVSVHFYQGFWMAVLLLPQFVAASIFFVLVRNVAVLILAHLILNMVIASRVGL